MTEPARVDVEELAKKALERGHCCGCALRLPLGSGLEVSYHQIGVGRVPTFCDVDRRDRDEHHLAREALRLRAWLREIGCVDPYSDTLDFEEEMEAARRALNGDPAP